MDDAWFEAKLREDIGVTTSQAESLRLYLHNSISPYQAAVQITTPIQALVDSETRESDSGSEALKDALLNLWAFLVDAVQDSDSDSVVTSIVGLVASIASLPAVERAGKISLETFRESADSGAPVRDAQLWSDLPLWWNYWSDTWHAGLAARDGPHVLEQRMAKQEEGSMVWTNMNTFAARALAGRAFDKGVNELLAGQLLILIRGAAREDSPLRNTDVPAAAVVMKIAGPELYRGFVASSGFGQQVTQDEWDGWRSSFERLETQQQGADVVQGTRDAAGRVVVAMALLSLDLDEAQQ